MATVSYLLDKRSKNKEAKHPLKLNVYVNGAGQRPFSTGNFFTPKEWRELATSRKKDDKETYKEVQGKKAKAETVLAKLEGKKFSWKAFGDLYKSPYVVVGNPSSIPIKNLFDEAVAKMKVNAQFKNASNFECAKNSLLKYGGNEVKLDQITGDWLNGYRRWGFDKGLSPTTISDYVRPLKRVYYKAIKDKYIDAASSPFVGEDGFKIGEAESADAALTPEQMRVWSAYVPKSDAQRKVKSFWFFSYYCNGIGWTDICKLKRKNINGEFIEFYRNKTRTTSKKPKLVQAVINQVMEEVMKEYGSENGTYIFSYLHERMSEETVWETIENHRRLFSRVLQRLSKQFGFRVPFGAARHTHATAKSEMGASMREVSNSLGHSRTSITENYLARIKPSAEKKNAPLLDAYFKGDTAA